MRDLGREGYSLEGSAVAALSPHVTAHINRFGHYELNMDTRPPVLTHDLWGQWL